MSDSLRPSGTVELKCIKCGWSFWVDPLDPMVCGVALCHSCCGVLWGKLQKLDDAALDQPTPPERKSDG